MSLDNSSRSQSGSPLGNSINKTSIKEERFYFNNSLSQLFHIGEVLIHKHLKMKIMFACINSFCNVFKYDRKIEKESENS